MENYIIYFLSQNANVDVQTAFKESDVSFTLNTGTQEGFTKVKVGATARANQGNLRTTNPPHHPPPPPNKAAYLRKCHNNNRN